MKNNRYLVILIAFMLFLTGCASTTNIDNVPINDNQILIEEDSSVELSANMESNIDNEKKNSSVMITQIMSSWEGIGAFVSVAEDPFWTEDWLTGKLAEPVEKEIVICFDGKVYHGVYSHSEWGMGYNYQRDIYEYHQDNYAEVISINHSTGEVNTINFPAQNNDFEVTEKEALQIAKEWLSETGIDPDSFQYDIKQKDSGDYGIIAHYFLCGIETYGHVRFGIDYDGTVLTYNPGMLSVFVQYLKNIP